MTPPTNQDAQLVIQLSQLAATRNLAVSTAWLQSDQFDPDYDAFIQKHPPGSDGYQHLRKVAVHYETIGTLWKHGLINEDLLFDWILIAPLWDRIRGFVLGEREKAGAPELGENFEAMAAAQKAWIAKHRAEKEGVTKSTVAAISTYHGDPKNLVASYDKAVGRVADGAAEGHYSRPLSHVALALDDGFMVVDVFESEEACQRLGQSQYFQQVLKESGFPGEPAAHHQVVPAHRLGWPEPSTR